MCQNLALDALDRILLGGRMLVTAEEIQGFKLENKGQVFFSKHVYEYIAVNAIYFARHIIISLEFEFLIAIKLSTDLF